MLEPIVFVAFLAKALKLPSQVHLPLGGAAPTNLPHLTAPGGQPLVSQARPQVGDIDGLMAKYKGRERQLYLCICEKYRVSPNLETKGGAQTGEEKKVPSTCKQRPRNSWLVMG